MPESHLKLSYLETLMHLLKGNVGTGIFAMGDAFRNSGVIVGAILMLFIGFVCLHCQHLLTQSANSLQRKHQIEKKLTYATTVELCFVQGPSKMSQFSRQIKKIVNACLVVTQLGFCCVYFIFISDNIKQIADYHGFELDIRSIMTIIFVPVLLPCLVRNLKYLTPISCIANLLMLIGITLVAYYSLSGDFAPISEIKYVPSIETLPLFFGTAVFCFEGIGLVLPLKNEMQNPKDFGKPLGVLNIGITFVALLYIFVGIIGYLKFGETVMGSITLNLPEHETLYQAVKLIISLSVLLTYCLQLFIVVEIVWPFILSKKLKHNKHPVVWELMLRISLVSLTFVMAQIVPLLSLFISLVGAVCSAALTLLFPALLDLLIRYVDEELTFYILTKDGFIVFLSLTGMVTGGYESISSIIFALSHKDAMEIITENTTIYTTISYL